MKRRVNLTASLLLAVMAVSPASAEPPTGSRLGNALETGPSASVGDAARGAREWARCTYEHHRSEVRALLTAQDPATLPRLDAALSGSIDCMGTVTTLVDSDGSTISMPPDVERGFLAEAALFDHHYPALSPLPLKHVYHAAWGAVSGRPAVVDDMSECVAETDPDRIIRLIAAAPYTPGEMTAIQALMPSVTACLVVGVRLSANRQTLRAALAEALYHRAYP